jgi:hypothetical protein
MKRLLILILLLLAGTAQGQTNPYRKRTFTAGIMPNMSLPGASHDVVRQQIRYAIEDTMAINPGLTIKYAGNPQIGFIKGPHKRNALTYYGRIPGRIMFSTTPPPTYKWWNGIDRQNSIYIGAAQELQRPIIGAWTDSKRDWERINAELRKMQALRAKP